MIEDPKITELLNKVAQSQQNLQEIERVYTESKTQTVGEIAASVSQLAVLSSDSIARRASVVRELYWETDIEKQIIADAFGLTSHKVLKVAGQKEFDIQCIRDCGNSVRMMVGSRSKRDELLLPSRRDKRYWGTKCEDCKKKDDEANERAQQQRSNQVRKRNAELSEMSWDDYTETKEWKNFRNSLLWEAGFRCQLCQNSPAKLKVLPRLDVPQETPRNFDGYAVFCTNCMSRAENAIKEIVQTDKVDIVKIEEYQHYSHLRSGGLI